MTVVKRKSNLRRLAVGRWDGCKWRVTASRQTPTCGASELDILDEALAKARQEGLPDFVVHYIDTDHWPVNAKQCGDCSGSGNCSSCSGQGCEDCGFTGVCSECCGAGWVN